MRKTAGRTSYLWLSNLLLAGCLSGCLVAAKAPYEEYNLAKAAMKAAKDADSARFASGFWNKADENFRDGEKLFKDSDFEPALASFKRARQYAERAENATRLKRFQSGDSFP